jgi:F0F1-type ATP synthase assembly protein I
VTRNDSDELKPDSKLTSGANLLGLGWQIASTLFIFTAAGYALDWWLDTLPWFLITGAVFGLIGVFTQVFRIAAELDRAEKRRRNERERSHPGKANDVGLHST